MVVREMNSVDSLRRRASHRPIGTFLAVLTIYSGLVFAGLYGTFGSAIPTLGIILYAWAPMITAGVTVWLLGESVRDWLGQLRNLRGGKWYLVGIAIMILGTEAETIVAVLLGGDVTVPYAPIGAYIFKFGITLFLAGALEELGWRGFLQPRLQQRFSALSASIVIGIVWGLWHVPMILTGSGDFTIFWEYMLNVTAMSVILGWLYNNTKGALPVVMVAHASHNMPPIGDAGGDVPAVFDIMAGDAAFYLLCASSIALYAGAQTLTRDGTLPGVPGQLRDYVPGQEGTAD
ncbi:CPBP family intramembrane metalloprotease [Halorubrum sp. BOL3-1]|uniref:type II CAAX endopeptidase family protein n=1 Tax=Halorubrum sp. BOL3-1 TaxID=2497325 RepID=UPI001004F9E2|nr:type II CAAX endopeptidase family protein [Halorubrum sp. BOL3-1]QAU14066.1 CPBP family intramembrane metalloprotease [Halorubrum sp. BOL3-1]